MQRGLGFETSAIIFYRDTFVNFLMRRALSIACCVTVALAMQRAELEASLTLLCANQTTSDFPACQGFALALARFDCNQPPPSCANGSPVSSLCVFTHVFSQRQTSVVDARGTTGQIASTKLLVAPGCVWALASMSLLAQSACWTSFKFIRPAISAPAITPVNTLGADRWPPRSVQSRT